MNELDNVLFEMGLTLEDVIEPDLNKQKEYYKLLEAILNSEGEKQVELLDYVFEIIQMDKKAFFRKIIIKKCQYRLIENRKNVKIPL